MKKLVSAILIVALGCAPLSAGENPNESSASARWLKVSFDATYILFGAYFLNAELKVGSNMSLVARGGYIDNRITINSNVNQTPGTFGKVELGARWYLRDACMEGFFLESRLGLDFGKTFDGNALVDPSGATLGPSMFFLGHGVYGGYSWVTDFGFFVDAVAGVGASVSWGVPNPFTVQWAPVANMNMGWAF